MNKSKGILVAVLVITTILSLSFGFWGVYQIGKVNGINEGLHKSAPLLKPSVVEEPARTWAHPFAHHDWFWEMGISRIICFLMFILCFSGFILRFFCGIGFWHWMGRDQWHDHDMWRRNWCCGDEREKDPGKS